MEISDLVRIGFTLPTATDLSAFFGNVAYVGDMTSTDYVAGFTPNEKGDYIPSVDALKQVLKADTQYYKDVEALLTQKGNANPNMAEVKGVILFKTNEVESFKEAFERLMTLNANFSQVSISSRLATDIEGVADSCKAHNRLGEFQTSDADVSSKTADNLAKKLADKNNDNVKLSFDSQDTDPLAVSIMAIQAGSKLGKNGDIYSTMSNVTPQTYSATIENNLKDQNVCYYSYVNPVNGGGVEQYASKLYFVGKMINGENAKRRRIRYFLDIQLKATSLDFLKKKMTYEDLSGAVLESMLSAVFIEGGNSGQVARDINGKAEFYLNVLSIAETRAGYNSLYQTQTYKVVGWYRDALTGEKVDIDLTVDPSDAEKSIIEVA